MSSQLPRLGMMGISGIGQMTAASQSLLQRAGRGASANGGTRRRKARKAKASNGGGTRKKKRAGAKGKLKKGSAAAKAWMAKIRKKRK